MNDRYFVLLIDGQEIGRYPTEKAAREAAKPLIAGRLAVQLTREPLPGDEDFPHAS